MKLGAGTNTELTQKYTRVKVQNDIHMLSYWQASEASETVLGVDNAKSGICYMYICMYEWYL